VSVCVDAGGIDVTTVAVSWLLSAVTTVVLIFLAFVIRNNLSSPHRRPTKSPATDTATATERQ